MDINDESNFMKIRNLSGLFSSSFFSQLRNNQENNDHQPLILEKLSNLDNLSK